MSDTGEMLSQTVEAHNGSEVGSIYDWVSDTAKTNPALVVGGALAVGAVVAMMVVSRKPESRARAVEKRIGRELRSIEKTLRRQRPISAASDRLADVSASLASTLSALDMGTLRGVVNRAGELSSQFSRRVGW
jgi:hypothetical protein